jgi:hypothetical protein
MTNPYGQEAPCLFITLDKNLNIRCELELPFTPNEEGIIGFDFVNDKELLLTNLKIYDINEQNVTIRASAVDALRLFMEIDPWLKGNRFKGDLLLV